MRIFDTYADYLEENGVEFRRVKERLDIAVVKAAQFDLAIIPPQDLSDDFKNITLPIKDFVMDGQPVARIYKVIS
jgi:hypothetical protein